MNSIITPQFRDEEMELQGSFLRRVTQLVKDRTRTQTQGSQENVEKIYCIYVSGSLSSTNYSITTLPRICIWFMSMVHVHNYISA